MSSVIIRVPDNSRRRIIDILREGCASDEERYESVIKLLSQYHNKTLEQWRELGLTVYSSQEKGLSKEEDGVNERLEVFTLDEIEGEQTAYIRTYNCMGVVQLSDKDGLTIQLEIVSRFDVHDKQYFLNYLLVRVFAGSLVEHIEVGDNSLWDMLLAFVFRHRLQRACKVGLFKQYRRVESNDMRFRGKMNLDEHLRHNIPFNGKLAYTTHEITFDNPINHLIRHAFERISRKWRAVLSGSKEITDFRHQCEQNTPGWQHGQVIECIKVNIRPVRHPYFHDYYEPLRKISLAILREEGAGLYSESEEAEGVIFDGSWLWETYLWTLFEPEPLGFIHPENLNQQDPIMVFESKYKSKLYPDFYRKRRDDLCCERTVVLDAKYRNLDGRLTDRDSGGESASAEVKQLLSYMFMLDAEFAGVVTPQQLNPHPEEPIKILAINRDAYWQTIQHSIPDSVGLNADEFAEQMKHNESLLIEKVRKGIAPSRFPAEKLSNDIG